MCYYAIKHAYEASKALFRYIFDAYNEKCINLTFVCSLNRRHVRRTVAVCVLGKCTLQSYPFSTISCHKYCISWGQYDFTNIFLIYAGMILACCIFVFCLYLIFSLYHLFLTCQGWTLSPNGSFQKPLKLCFTPRPFR